MTPILFPINAYVYVRICPDYTIRAFDISRTPDDIYISFPIRSLSLYIRICTDCTIRAIDISRNSDAVYFISNRVLPIYIYR